MPVSLLEAMGRGCIPVATDIDSGIPELIAGGINSYRVPVGNIQLFAQRLTEIYISLEQRAEMSLNAYRTIIEGGYRTQDMVDKYIDLLKKVVQEVESSTYHRPDGKIAIPPYLKVSWQRLITLPICNLSNYIKKMILKFVRNISEA